MRRNATAEHHLTPFAIATVIPAAIAVPAVAKRVPAAIAGIVAISVCAALVRLIFQGISASKVSPSWRLALASKWIACLAKPYDW
ncbi:unnamed protein product [Urochloa humidicola]